MDAYSVTSSENPALPTSTHCPHCARLLVPANNTAAARKPNPCKYFDFIKVIFESLLIYANSNLQHCSTNFKYMIIEMLPQYLIDRTSNTKIVETSGNFSSF